MVAPTTMSATLTSAAPLTDVMSRLCEFPWGSPVRLLQPDAETLSVSSGSRLRYRLLGRWTQSNRLPLKVVLRSSASGSGTLVHLDIKSDEGWYLVQTELGAIAYRRRFQELLEGLAANGVVGAVESR